MEVDQSLNQLFELFAKAPSMRALSGDHPKIAFNN